MVRYYSVISDKFIKINKILRQQHFKKFTLRKMGLFTVFNIQVKYISLFCRINFNTNVLFLAITF